MNTLGKVLGLVISCGVIMSGVVFYMAYPKDQGIALAKDVRRNTETQKKTADTLKEINRQLQDAEKRRLQGIIRKQKEGNDRLQEENDRLRRNQGGSR